MFYFADGGGHVAGDWAYTAPANVAVTSDELFTYTVTDGDGDGAQATLKITVNDANTFPAGGVQSFIVDEEGLLPNGLAGNGTGDVAGEALTANGILIHTFNDDGPFATDPINFSPLDTLAVFDTSAAAVKSGGLPLTYFVDTTTGTLYASTDTSSLAQAQATAAFKVDLNTSTGAYTFTLLKPIDHKVSGTEDDVTIDLTYQVKDFEGDTANGTVTIAINDDVPVARPDDAQSILENAAGTLGGNVINPDVADDADLSGKDSVGADGATLTHVDLPGGGGNFVAIVNGAPVNVAGVGTYTFFSNGDWTFDPDQNVLTTDIVGTFGYRITDGDGDTSESTQPITVTNATLPFVQTNNFTGIVEEEHLNSAAAVGIDDLTSTPDGDNNPATPDGDDDVLGNLDVTTAITGGNLSTMITGIDGTATYSFNVTDGTVGDLRRRRLRSPRRASRSSTTSTRAARSMGLRQRRRQRYGVYEPPTARCSARPQLRRPACSPTRCSTTSITTPSRAPMTSKASRPSTSPASCVWPTTSTARRMTSPTSR